jgi:deoxycytidylate deaminase
MGLAFHGTLDDLRQVLSEIGCDGNWRTIQDGYQFLHSSGGVVDWCAHTGALSIGGKRSAKKNLTSIVKTTLEAKLRDSPSRTGGEARDTSSGGAAGVDDYLIGQRFSDSELVIGLVGAVGADLEAVIKVIEERLRIFKYSVSQVRVSSDIIPTVAKTPETHPGEYERINALMDAGDEARRFAKNNSILALGVAANIAATRPSDRTTREQKHCPRKAYVINSLKHPEEVARLREIYPTGFYLIGVYSDAERRHRRLTTEKRLTPQQADRLMRRDENEYLAHGQRTSDTFHLSDFFVRVDENQDRLKSSLWRILDVLFGCPHLTPTFDEYAMFMAFSASLRSADLSRQVGAVVTRHNEIIATGANDCPRFGGGLYWPTYDATTSSIVDVVQGRDYTRGQDSNDAEQLKIIEEIVGAAGDLVPDPESLRLTLANSPIKDLTEYGRVVHAEMEAILSCARNHVSSRDATLYCTTFPCHNCAKHIIAAGIVRVVYVEPYPKSKALEFHTDSATLAFSDGGATATRVYFEPFVGVGPRRFFDLFSMKLGSGYALKRKNNSGKCTEWTPEASRLRIQMLPGSYIELEKVAAKLFNDLVAREKEQ